MNGRKDISSFNRRLRIQEWNQLQDAGGGTYYDDIPLLDFTVWGNKANRSGSQFNNEAQQQWTYDTTFTIRYDARVKSTMTVDESGERWVINSIEVDNEGYKGLMKLRATHIETNVS